jgi:hypothetical protein
MDTILRWSFREWLFVCFAKRTTDGKPRLYQEVEGLVCSLQFCYFASLGGREVSLFGTKPPDTTAWGVSLFSFHISVYFFYTLFSSPLLFNSLFYWKKEQNPNHHFLDCQSFLLLMSSVAQETRRARVVWMMLCYSPSHHSSCVRYESWAFVMNSFRSHDSPNLACVKNPKTVGCEDDRRRLCPMVSVHAGLAYL